MAPDASAPPVVLVHGYVISARYMRPVLARIGREVDCWAPDLPGHGRSATPAQALDVPGYADALVAWMDAVGLARALLVGHSLGCQVVAHVAVRHPGRVAGLVLVGPTVDARARSAGAQAWRLVRDAFHERFSLWLLELMDIVRVGPRRMVAMARATLEDRIEAVLPAVRAPVRVVYGEHDPLVPPGWAARVAALAQAPPPTVVLEAAHGVNYDAPGELAAIVLRFAHELRAGVAQPP
jgi:pimeloyl-ACP methyl ester carboxylesterase